MWTTYNFIFYLWWVFFFFSDNCSSSVSKGHRKLYNFHWLDWARRSHGAKSCVGGGGGSSQSSKSSRGQSALVEKPTVYIEWKFNRSIFHPIPYYVVVVFTSVLNNDFAQWGTSTCYEYQVRIRVNREASHSVRSPLSWRPSGQIVLQATMLHPVSSRTIGPIKIVQCAIFVRWLYTFCI